MVFIDWTRTLPPSNIAFILRQRPVDHSTPAEFKKKKLQQKGIKVAAHCRGDSAVWWPLLILASWESALAITAIGTAARVQRSGSPIQDQEDGL